MVSGRRTGILLAAVAALVVLAPPAGAHTRAAAASNYDSRITAVPDVDGVDWRTYAGGDLLEVTVSSDVEVGVAGYDGEPYLRISADGVSANLNSPATYLNADRYADVAVPPRADASAPPEWRQVAQAASYAWHDHRSHWMAPTPPPAVRDAPRTAQLVQRWTVEVTVDGDRHELAGELWWVPGSPVSPWLVLALVVTSPAAAGVVRSRRRKPGPAPRRRLDMVRGHLRPAAAVVGAVAAINLLHVVDEVGAWPAPPLDIAFGVLHTALFVGMGLAGAVISWRATQGPFLCLGIAAGAVLFHQGLLQSRLLTASQLPTVWPAPLLRLVVALSIAQSLWAAGVLVAGMRATASAAGAATGRPGVPVPAGPSTSLRSSSGGSLVRTTPPPR